MGGIIKLDTRYYILNEISDSGNHHKCISKWWGVRLIGNWIFIESKVLIYPTDYFVVIIKGGKNYFLIKDYTVTTVKLADQFKFTENVATRYYIPSDVRNLDLGSDTVNKSLIVNIQTVISHF